MICGGASQLSWYPSLLASLKRLVQWSRCETSRTIPRKISKNPHLEGHGQIVRSMRLATFASWKSSTLDYCCVGSTESLHSVSENFHVQRFVDKRDCVKLQPVADTLVSDCRRQRFTCTRYGDWGLHCSGADIAGPSKNEDVHCMMKDRCSTVTDKKKINVLGVRVRLQMS